MSKVTCKRQLIIRVQVPHVACPIDEGAEGEREREKDGDRVQHRNEYDTAKCLCINTDNKSTAIKI